MARPNTGVCRGSSYSRTHMTFWPWLVLAKVGGGVFFLLNTDYIIARARPDKSGRRGSSFSELQITFLPRLVLSKVGGAVEGVFLLWNTEDVLIIARLKTCGCWGSSTLDYSQQMAF